MHLARIPSRFWIVAAATLAVDWLTKWAVNTLLVPHEHHEMIGSAVRFTLAYDWRTTFWLGIPGTPHLRVPGGAAVMFAIKFIILLMLVWLAARAARAPSVWTVVLGASFGAGVGNTVEQLATGGVINFFDLGYGAHRWPTFNVADAVLVGGGISLIVLMQRDLARERGWRGALLNVAVRLPPALRKRPDDGN